MKRRPVDIVAAKELQLYVENDADIYRQRLVPIEKNLARKKYRGIYDSKKAVKAFQYATDAGAKKYETGKETGKMPSYFTPIERKYAAARMAKNFEHEFASGNYSNYKQKYLKKRK